MQIESIKLFCDLAETKNFTKAAKMNGITQSAASQQLHSMEHNLGCKLIERSKKRFRLTQEGEIVCKFGRDIFKIYSNLISTIEDQKDSISGTIRLATIYSIGLHDLPSYLRDYIRHYPTVSVQVEYRRSNQVYEDVLDNSVDIGMVAYPVEDSKIEVIPLHEDKMVLITSEDHPWKALATPGEKFPRIDLSLLNDQNFVGFESGTPTRTATDQMLENYGIRDTVVMEFDNVETVKRAVEINNGVSIVPSLTVAQEIETGSLNIFELTHDGKLLNFTRPIAAILRKDKLRNKALKEFIKSLSK